MQLSMTKRMKLKILQLLVVVVEKVKENLLNLKYYQCYLLRLNVHCSLYKLTKKDPIAKFGDQMDHWSEEQVLTCDPLLIAALSCHL